MGAETLQVHAPQPGRLRAALGGGRQSAQVGESAVGEPAVGGAGPGGGVPGAVRRLVETVSGCTGVSGGQADNTDLLEDNLSHR
ncbi:hypothetical protein GCM10009546_32210 [Actinomadura livida]|uniref:Uncharacterized protein n=1 Tax=Actinomadura livida TaxID=79909 RepID=A0ABN1EIG5_9ACTN|nr:hypothetical protein GCM10010208_41220 [Actinomadura livida]